MNFRTDNYKPLVQAGDLRGIAAQIRAMKRLWDIDQLPGLHARRDREAELIEQARTSYPPEELVAGLKTFSVFSFQFSVKIKTRQ